MPADIQFPRACVICVFSMPTYVAPSGVFYSPGVGHVCEDCADHAVDAVIVLGKTKGIASHMIPDGDRNDICPPRFLRRPEEQP